MAPFQLKDVQKVPYQLTAVDADGNPAQLEDGSGVTVSSSDTSCATVLPDTTPAPGTVASGEIIAGAKLGLVQINAAVTKADGSPGPTGAVSIEIVSGPAASISFGLGTPVG